MGATSFANVGTAAGPACAPVDTPNATVPSRAMERCFIGVSVAQASGLGNRHFDAQVGATIVTDVMFTRLIGSALMTSPLTITVCPLWAARLNAETPMSRNVFVPIGGVVGMSFAGGAFAMLTTGSVAASRVQIPPGSLPRSAFGVDSRRQPVTLTMSIFLDCAG